MIITFTEWETQCCLALFMETIPLTASRLNKLLGEQCTVNEAQTQSAVIKCLMKMQLLYHQSH